MGSANVEEFINGKKEEYTSILCELIRAKTINPPGDEYLAADVLTELLKRIAVKHDIYEKKKGRTNIIAKVGNESGKKILISTHLDVVPAGEGWATDPFEPVIKEGIVYGRGACDNKGQVTSSMLVLEYLKCMESQLKNQYIFLFAADEETGSALGIKYLLNENLLAPDYALVIDVGGEMKKITIAEKGVLNLKIIAKGKQAHGSTPSKGISAIANMSKLIAKLDHYILKHKLHRYLSRPTINFGTISGGSAPNVVAGSCEAILNIRYLPSQTPESIVEELKKISEMFGDFDFEVMIKIPPAEVSEKNPIVETIKKVSDRHGLNAKLHGLSGGTDAKSFIERGIPAVGFDFADDYVAHAANEYCRLDNLFRFSAVLIDICLEFESQ